MSGNVQQVNTNLTVSSICPIVLNPADAVLTYVSASSIAINSNVQSGLNDCFPNSFAYNQVYTVQQAGSCCGNNVNSRLAKY